MRCRSMLAASFTVLALAGISADSNWPQFRGPQAGVAADDPALPETWSPTENIVWKADVRGVGWGSPVVWGDHIFLTSAVNTERDDRPALKVYTAAEVAPTTAVLRWVVYDFDVKTGKLRWEREVARAAPSQAKHMKNSYASETTATDGERVYAYFGSAGLFAFDMDGKAIWSKPMTPMKMRSDWGPAASPVVFKGRVYIVNDNEEHSFIAAYDAKTGAEAWRIDREEGSNWSTPFIWEGNVRAVQPADPDPVRAPWTALRQFRISC